MSGHTFLRASRVKLAEYRVYRRADYSCMNEFTHSSCSVYWTSTVFSDKNPSWFVLSWRRFGEAGCLHSQGIEKLIFDSETKATNYKHLCWMWICQHCRTGYRWVGR